MRSHTYSLVQPVVMRRLTFAVIFLALTSSRVAVSVITLQCDSLQQLCPNDDQPRMCVCNSTGNVLVWSTSVTGTVAAFLSSASAGTNETEGGFTAVLTERANGVSVSTLTFNPSNVRATGTLGVEVTCEGSSVMTDNIAVTSAVVPGIRQFGAHSVSCDTTNNTYQITLQWNDNDTGGPDVSILYYLVEVTSPSGFVCPPEQCNVTANITTITGLSCSTDYSFTVRAVNCIGSSTVSMPLTTSRVTKPVVDQACFVNDTIRITLMIYNTGNGNCMAVNNFNISSSCTGDLVNTDYGPVVYQPAANVPPSDSCVVTVISVADCGYSEPATITTSGECSSVSLPTTIPTMSSPSISMSTSDISGTTPPTDPIMVGIGAAAAGGAGGAAAAIGVAAVMATIFVCIFCPCGCCILCRRKCCCCCSEEKICYRWGSGDDYRESTPQQ